MIEDTPDRHGAGQKINHLDGMISLAVEEI